MLSGTGDNGLTMVALGEPPSKYRLTRLDILDSSYPCGSFKYFKLRNGELTCAIMWGI